MDLWTTQRGVAHKLHNANNSSKRKRTNDVLSKPDNLKSYRHIRFCERVDHRAIDMSNQATQPSAPQAGRAIITIIGSDRVGIIAGIANVLAEANVNILDISQSVIREFFTMIMMVDLAGAAVSFHELSERLARKGDELSVRVEIQREEIFKAMHRITAAAAACRRGTDA